MIFILVYPILEKECHFKANCKIFGILKVFTNFQVLFDKFFQEM